jgi:hypothetical protein
VKLSDDAPGTNGIRGLHAKEPRVAIIEDQVRVREGLSLLTTPPTDTAALAHLPRWKKR